MYQVKILFYEVGNPIPKEEEPNFENEFETFDDAFAMAYNDAVDLCDYLNKDLEVEYENQISFGIADFENEVHVYYYYLESEADTTGNTELVATYFVREI